MLRYSVRTALGVGLVTMGISTLAGGGAASANPPVGTCTNSYEPYTFAELSPIDTSLTSQLFTIIDSNQDGIICFKEYPNGAHNGHLGNLVDDKAAPHS